MLEIDPSGSSPGPPETPDVETASDDYSGRFSGPVGEYFLDMQTRLTLDLISKWPATRVLDVGGGHAQVAVPLVRAGHTVTVTGSSADCRSRLEQRLDAAEYEFRECDLLDLPFEDSEFDVVVAFRLLPHVNRWKRLLDEMCRVARLGIIVDYPDRRSFNILQNGLYRWKKSIEKNTRTFECFSRSQLRDEFATRGYERATFRPEFFFRWSSTGR